MRRAIPALLLIAALIASFVVGGAPLPADHPDAFIAGEP